MAPTALWPRAHRSSGLARLRPRAPAPPHVPLPPPPTALRPQPLPVGPRTRQAGPHPRALAHAGRVARNGPSQPSEHVAGPFSCFGAQHHSPAQRACGGPRAIRLWHGVPPMSLTADCGVRLSPPSRPTQTAGCVHHPSPPHPRVWVPRTTSVRLPRGRSLRRGEAAAPHLAEAALAQHHQEVEVGQLHPVLAAVGVALGGGIGRLLLRGLGRLTDLGPLRGRGKRAEAWLGSGGAPRGAVLPAARAPGRRGPDTRPARPAASPLTSRRPPEHTVPAPHPRPSPPVTPAGSPAARSAAVRPSPSGRRPRRPRGIRPRLAVHLVTPAAAPALGPAAVRTAARHPASAVPTAMPGTPLPLPRGGPPVPELGAPTRPLHPLRPPPRTL